MKSTLLSFVVALLVAQPVAAQFSSDLPGIPRARTGFLSDGQGRFEMDISGYKLPGTDGDSIAGSFRVGFGHSWRIGTNVEFGYDVTLGEIRGLRPAAVDGRTQPTDLDGTVAYGIRFGLKYQVVNLVDPDGYGISAAVGAGFQPELQPVLMISKRDDTTLKGGHLGDDPADGGIDETIGRSVTLMGAVSYRAPRIEADGALIIDNSTVPMQDLRVAQYDGASLALGARYRLTSSFGVGLAYWGSGAPPWRDRIGVGLRAEDESKFAFLITLGAGLERGTDIMISSPTGSFSESVSFYLRVH